MAWQDLVIGIGNWIFVLALIPSIVSRKKPALATSIMTVIVVTVFVYCFFTLEFYHSMISLLAVGTCWWILFFQVVLKKKDKLSINY